MAEDNSAGAVFIELGLDLNQLESDFIAADQTIQQNLNRLNRERNLIELRAQVEIGDLEDAEQILEVRTRSLNQQMQIQRDRIQLVEAAHRQLVNSQGESATATQNMEARLQRERLMLQRLEQQLRQTTQAQENLSSGGSSTNNSTSKLKDLFSSNFNDKLKQLNEMLPLAGGLAEKTTAALSAIPTPAKAAILAITAIPVAVKAAESAILSLAEPAITAGDAFYVASRGAQMTIKDFGQLSTICKVTGIELSEVTNAMRRLNMQIVKGGDSAALKMLRRYGVEVRNTNGELKNALEMSLAVAEGLEKAQAAGKGKDFIAGVFGRQATGDIVTYLEDLKGNVELAKSIVKNGLFDPARAHNIQGEINAMNTQAGQLGSAFSSALLPIAEELVPHITKRMGELTKVIADNADGIKTIANSIAEVTKTIGDLTAKTVEFGVNAIGTVGEALNGDTNAITKNYGNLTQDVKSANDLMERELAKMLPTQRAATLNNPVLFQQFESQMKQQFKNLQKWREENVKSWADFRRADEKAMEEARKSANQHTEEELQASLERAKKYAEELEKLQIKLDFPKDSYGRALAELDLSYQKDLNQPYISDEEKTTRAELNAARIEQIEQEKENKLSDIRNKANEKLRNNLENQLAAIEKQKDDWISAGMEEAEAEELIQRQKAKTIEDLERSWNERVLAINGSALEQKLANIEREKQAWIDKGIPEKDATNLAEIQKSKAIEEENLKLANDESDAQDRINDLLQSRTGTLEEIDEVYEQYYEHVRKTAAQVQSIWQTELEQRLVQIDQEAEAFKKAMVEEEALAKWVAQAKVDAERNAAMQILKSQLQAYHAFERGGYEALKRYELNQLYKQGITQKDLQMTPEQLHKFDFAQKAIQNSLMPNFMTDIDFRRQIAAQSGASNFKLPEVPVGMPKYMRERLNSLDERLGDLNKEIAKANENLKNLGKNREGLSSALEKSRNDLDTLQRQVPQLSYSPEGNPIITSSPPQDTPERAAKIAELNQRIADLSTALNSNSIIQPTSHSENSAGNAMPSLTTNVSINEAHAWDNEHIQELAEKVAGEIESRISREIGGDLNSY